jgi:hypothetical protein
LRWQVPTNKKAKTEDVSPCKSDKSENKTAGGEAIEPDANAEEQIVPSQMERVLNEVADAREAKASASPSPAKTQASVEEQEPNMVEDLAAANTQDGESEASAAAFKADKESLAADDAKVGTKTGDGAEAEVETNGAEARSGAETQENCAAATAGRAAAAQATTDGDEVMVLDDEEECSGNGASESPQKKSEAQGAAASSGAKEAPAKEAAAPKKLSQAEKEKRIEVLRSELSGLARLSVGGDAVPSLRPSAAEIADEFDCSTLSVRTDQPLPLKTRQIVARVIEGAYETVEVLSASLLAGSQQMELDNGAALVAAAVQAVGEMVEARPDIAESRSGQFVRRWKVKDMADIPERCRQLVETHRKMQAALSDRMVCIQNIITADSVKSFNKFERQLLVLKDKYLKLEEKEGKDRERLESKIEAYRKKQEEKEDRQRKKEEERRLREEQNAEKERMQAEREQMRAEREQLKAEREQLKAEKEEQARIEREQREKEKALEKTRKETEKEECRLLKEKEKEEQQKKKAEEKEKKVMAKKGVSMQQASFMSAFLKKAPTTSPDAKPAGSASSAAPSDRSKAASASLLSFVSPEKKAPSGKVSSNFHPWEKPKNSIVAGFPYGPDFGEAHAAQALPPAPETPALSSWLSVWRTAPARKRAERPMRFEDREHPAMRVFQLHMNIPQTIIQLVDVDVDAMVKVMWDIEDEDAEQKLSEIMAEGEEDGDGVVTYRGRQYEIRTEGGGWFEARRPAFCGTWNKISKVITGRNPFAKDPELDYAYESDADWESDAGEGEDLGSDLDEEEEEEDMGDDGDRGFVVPDGQSDDGPVVAPVKRLKKLEQVVVYRPAQDLPPELMATLAVGVLDSLPMVLSADPGVCLEEDADFFGDDLGSAKAPTLEAAVHCMHRHPTASSFTWVRPESGSKYGGYVFLKGQDGPKGKSEQEGMVSGYLREIPKAKRLAIQSMQREESEAAAAAQAAAVKAGGCAAGKKAKRDMSEADYEHVEVAQKEAEKAKKEEQARRRKMLKRDGKGAIPDAHLLEVVKIVHGSVKAKVDLVKEFQAKFPEVGKSRVEKYMSTCAGKKGLRWHLHDECLAFSPFIAEIAKDVWKQRVQADKPAEDSTGVQLQLAFTPK